jgi:hypothetical protein
VHPRFKGSSRIRSAQEVEFWDYELFFSETYISEECRVKLGSYENAKCLKQVV